MPNLGRRLFLYVWASRQELLKSTGRSIRLLEEVSDQMFRIVVDFKHIRSPPERLPLELHRDVGVVGCSHYQEKVPLPQLEHPVVSHFVQRCRVIIEYDVRQSTVMAKI